jgi:hypothetical protein
LIAGILIIIISITLAAILGAMDRRRRRKGYALLEWQTSETLQLQRVAFQGIGQGTWSGLTDAIPVTGRGEMLVPLAQTHRFSENPEMKPAPTTGHDESVTPISIINGPPILHDTREELRGGEITDGLEAPQLAEHSDITSSVSEGPVNLPVSQQSVTSTDTELQRPQVTLP